jgi:hypothetical protein
MLSDAWPQKKAVTDEIVSAAAIGAALHRSYDPGF